MELIRKADIVALTNAGVVSRQLLFPENSTEAKRHTCQPSL